MKIAIIKLGALGDVLRATCLLKPLKRKHPDAEIWWYTLIGAAPLLEGLSSITRLIRLDPRASAPLPMTSFDWVLSLDEDDQACRLASALKTSRRFGAFRDEHGRLSYTPDSKPWFAMGLLNRDSDGSLRTANALKKANAKTYPTILFEMLELSAEPEDAKPVLATDPKEEAWAQEWAAKNGGGENHKLVGLNLSAGSRWRTKQLSMNTTRHLIQTLHQRCPEVRFVLLGGPEEVERHRLLMASAGDFLIDAGTSNPLRRFISIVNRCRGVITSDSLGMHIAVALEKPVLAFFGSTSAAEIELGARGKRWLPPKECECFYKPACEQPAFCLDALDLTEAVNAVNAWR